jgi:hypothetical protein
MDMGKLLGPLIRYAVGRTENKAWSPVQVPSPKDEDDREHATLKKERTGRSRRTKGLLARQGVRLPVKADFPQRLESVRTWDGAPLPPRLRVRLQRQEERLEHVEKQIKELERLRAREIRRSPDPMADQVRLLLRRMGEASRARPGSSWRSSVQVSSPARY